MIRLVGIDIDGTLLDTQGRIPQANVDAIRDAVAAGIHVALVTGRSYPASRPIAGDLPSSRTLIVSNGAVERGMDGSTFARRLLDRGVARAVLDSTRGFRHAAALIFDRDGERQVLFETMDWEHPARKAYWTRRCCACAPRAGKSRAGSSTTTTPTARANSSRTKPSSSSLPKANATPTRGSRRRAMRFRCPASTAGPARHREKSRVALCRGRAAVERASSAQVVGSAIHARWL